MPLLGHTLPRVLAVRHHCKRDCMHAGSALLDQPVGMPRPSLLEEGLYERFAGELPVHTRYWFYSWAKEAEGRAGEYRG